MEIPMTPSKLWTDKFKISHIKIWLKRFYMQDHTTTAKLVTVVTLYYNDKSYYRNFKYKACDISSVYFAHIFII